MWNKSEVGDLQNSEEFKPHNFQTDDGEDQHNVAHHLETLE